MTGFHVLFPDGFEPEDWGWEVASPHAPGQLVSHQLYELERFGFVSTYWLRWEIPFKYPASLCRLGVDERSGRYVGLYVPVVDDRESVPCRELMHRRDYGLI